MEYKKININAISKFSITGLDLDESKYSNSIKLSTIFWNHLFNKDVFKDFVDTYYDDYKKKNESKKGYDFFYKEYEFILSTLDNVKKDINCFIKKDIPSGEDVFFSFRIFTTIISYYNEFFLESDIVIDLREGLIFKRGYKTIEKFFDNLDFYSNTDFFIKILSPLIIKSIQEKIHPNGKYLLKFDIFWPGEIITIGILSKILKEYNNSIKIVIDFSAGNEQFDFSQRIEMIKDSGSLFFQDFDYFIIDRDFGKGIDSILQSLNNTHRNIKIINTLYSVNNQIQYNKIENEDLSGNMFQAFIYDTFHTNSFHKTLGNTSIYARFLPYKCYWNRCNFCAINSQNKFTYNGQYSYEFFINKWVDFIEENNITSLNFKDEALPPVVVVGFAKKVLERGLKINYQFRTRYEKMYTKENCKIIALSGAGFCGMGLESAVDRVNDEIGNKGNSSLTLKDKIRIIHNFDQVGVGIHNYAIMGFPGESDEEAKMTFHFLRGNIEKSRYFTCSPNIFALMKGPEIFTNRKKYGIEVDETDVNNPFFLSFPFKCKGKERNMTLLQNMERELHRTQFIPWISSNNQTVNPTHYWHYIDRSSIFYLMKRYHKVSPYYKYKNINNEALKMNFEILLDQKFKISPYIQVFDYEGDDRIYIYDWCLCADISVPKEYKNFIINYDNDVCLRDNLEKENIKNDIFLKDNIKKLLLARSLIHIYE